MRPGSTPFRTELGVFCHCCAVAMLLLLPGAAIAAPDAPATRLSNDVIQAIRNGDTARLAGLLSTGADIHARDEGGNTPLILAAFYAGPDCVDLLLKRGADPNAANNAGVTPLIRAAIDLDKTRLLLKAGAKVNIRTKLGNTPLILASRRFGNSATVKLLLEQGASPKERNDSGVSPILAAAASGDTETAKLLLDKGADANDYPDGHFLECGARTPLMWAAFLNDMPMVRLLIDRGADPNKVVILGTPLSQAAWNDSLEAARFLVDHGARVDSRDLIANFTPLHWAASCESPSADLVKLLLSHGADPNAAGGDPVDAFMTVPQTPLMLALKRGNTPIVQALLAAGAKPPPDQAPATVAAQRKLPERLDQALLRSAVEKALVPLQSTAARTPDIFARQATKQQCISCHQQYLPMAAVGQARKRSLHLDLNAAQAQIDLLHHLFETSSNVFDGPNNVAEAIFHPEPVFTRGYELFGLACENVPPSADTDVMVHHLAVIQAAGGCWHRNLPRPPIQSGDISATALAIQALQHYAWPGRKPEFAACVERGRRWLWAARVYSNEDAGFQLLGLHWAGESPEKLHDLAKNLLNRQREDGGWSQLPTLHSDAYATGQALFALASSGQLPVTDQAFVRGLRFLLATQHDDGTWHVVRRAFPFQPTMSSAFSYSRDGWISSAATSWAVLGITQAIDPLASPPPPIVQKETTATEKPNTASEPTTPVQFAAQIKPLLERSCITCHGPEHPRSHYRIDSRQTLLKGGDSGDAAIIPGHSGQSPLLRHVTDISDELAMPPVEKRNRFPALSPAEVQLLRAWIDQGAVWPDDVLLAAPRQ